MKIQAMIMFMASCIGFSNAMACKEGYVSMGDHAGLGLNCVQKCKPYYTITPEPYNGHYCKRRHQSIGVNDNCDWHSPTYTTRIAGGKKLCWLKSDSQRTDSYVAFYPKRHDLRKRKYVFI